MARCDGHVGDQPLGCGAATDGICNVCCGDPGCNNATCFDVRRKCLCTYFES